MKLHFTPRSHFSRKVRILLDAWNVDVALVDAGNVAESSADAFGPNPLMKVPALVDGERVVVSATTSPARPPCRTWRTARRVDGTARIELESSASEVSRSSVLQPTEPTRTRAARSTRAPAR